MRRIGFVADTHGRKNDGSDLPEGVLKAFQGVDLIVHLGDIGKKVIIDRLATVAPVWVATEDRKGYGPPGSTDPAKVLEVGGHRIGLCFNLAQPDKKIVVEDNGIRFPEAVPLEKLLDRRFKAPVTAVAFGGTHRQLEQRHEGILFFNPGSPSLPSDSRGAGDLGSVAVLDVGGKQPKVKLTRIKG